MIIEKIELEKSDLIAFDDWFIDRDGEEIKFGALFDHPYEDLEFKVGRPCRNEVFFENFLIIYDGNKEIVIRFYDEDPEYDEKIILTLE